MIDKVALPTVGRIVLYHSYDMLEPFPAIVVVATEDQHTIPVLNVFLHDGSRIVNDVKHRDEAGSGGAAYWDWMPYQKGQAAKTEALQAELDAKLSAAGSRQQPTPNARALAAEKAQAALPRSDWGDELTKSQASTPSPVDGKR